MFLDLLSLNDELPDDLLWGSDSGSGTPNGMSNGSLDGLVGSSSAGNSITSQPGPGIVQANMGMRQPMMNPQMGTMANPNQNMTLVNALAGKSPMPNVRGPTPSSTPNNSISDNNMTSMGGPGPMNQQGNTKNLI